jgi:hypothetical protein
MEDRAREQLAANLDRMAATGNGGVAATGDVPETSPGPQPAQHLTAARQGRPASEDA